MNYHFFPLFGRSIQVKADLSTRNLWFFNRIPDIACGSEDASIYPLRHSGVHAMALPRPRITANQPFWMKAPARDTTLMANAGAGVMSSRTPKKSNNVRGVTNIFATTPGRSHRARAFPARGRGYTTSSERGSSLGHARYHRSTPPRARCPSQTPHAAQIRIAEDRDTT